VTAGAGILPVVSTERVALPLGVADQTVFRVDITVEKLVLGVVPLVPEFPPAALFEDYHRKSRGRQLLGHDASGGPGTDDDEINLFL
jgi:hypothetical protein